MNKLFKPKTMRRILLFLALIFPVVYLCGGLFFYLNGAHGTDAIADDDTSYHYDLNVEIDGNTYRRWVYSDDVAYWYYIGNENIYDSYLYQYPQYQGQYQEQS